RLGPLRRFGHEPRDRGRVPLHRFRWRPPRRSRGEDRRSRKRVIRWPRSRGRCVSIQVKPLALKGTAMSLTYLPEADQAVADALRQELARERDSVELIASENFTSPAVLEAVGSVLTNKYAEGY